jgi:hypothetical protein
MKPYKPTEYTPDGGVSLIGLPILAIALGMGAVALGWLASFIGQAFYLIVLFPIGIGLGLIFVGSLASTPAKLRSIPVAAVFGLLAGLLAMVSMHFFDYRRAMDGAPPGFEMSFLQYLDFEANQGVVIGRANSGFNIGYVGTWIYWGVETLIVAGFSLLGMAGVAAAPFCRGCETWKKEHNLGALGGAPEPVLEAFRAGDFDSLHQHKASAISQDDLVFTAHICPNCRQRAPIDVKLQHKVSNDKGEESLVELAHLTYPGSALKEFESLFGKVPN